MVRKNGCFQRKGNVRRGICIAVPKKVASTCGNASLTGNCSPQLAGSNFGAILSSRKLREAFWARKCFPASCGSEFRVRFAGLHAEQSALQSRNADFPTNNRIFVTKMVCRVALEQLKGVAVVIPVIFSDPKVQSFLRSAHGRKKFCQEFFLFEKKKYLCGCF